MTFVGNAFSLGMLPKGATPQITELDDVPNLTGAFSVIGHKDTADILGLAFNRATVTLADGDTLFVAQLCGPRLPEGCTTLPPGAHFRWFKITI